MKIFGITKYATRSKAKATTRHICKDDGAGYFRHDGTNVPFYPCSLCNRRMWMWGHQLPSQSNQDNICGPCSRAWDRGER